MSICLVLKCSAGKKKKIFIQHFLNELFCFFLIGYDQYYITKYNAEYTNLSQVLQT